MPNRKTEAHTHTTHTMCSNNLRSYKLSMMDRMVPCCHRTIIFFYTRTDINPQSLLRSLKDSLSKTLTRYFPVAGRLVEGNSLVDCSDQGVEFVEARVINGRLSQLQDITQIHRFLPCRSGAVCVRYGPTGPLFAVQVNIFNDCDEVVVGVCIAHKIFDGLSILTFLNEWAADARGAVELTHHPRLDGASLFPHPGPIIEAPIPHFTPVINERRRLVFSPSSIARLMQRRSSADGGVFRPSRMEALTGLLLRCTIKARARLNRDVAVVAAAHNVEMRGRLQPPLPVHTFGNIVESAIIPFPATDPDGLSFEKQMRSAVTGFDSIRQRPEMMTAEEVVTGGGDPDVYTCYFSSLWRLPFYGVDFGWGKPSWVAPGRSEPVLDFIFFYPGREDGEVEVWVQMDEDMLGELDKDGELATFASPSTSIIGLFTAGGQALDRPAISSPAVKRTRSAM